VPTLNICSEVARFDVYYLKEYVELSKTSHG